MNITSLFEYLGAPLSNRRCSWGAVRSDGTVVLRVWQDQTVRENGRYRVQLTDNGHFQTHQPGHPGYRERLEHVERVRAGAPTYLVMCRARNPSDAPRETEGFNDRELFVGGEVHDINGEVWVEVVDRVPLQHARP